MRKKAIQNRIPENNQGKSGFKGIRGRGGRTGGGGGMKQKLNAKNACGNWDKLKCRARPNRGEESWRKAPNMLEANHHWIFPLDTVPG